MPDVFDIGPLTWVHDEIKLALDQVVNDLDSFEKSPENVSLLRHALTHLNQVNGALDMVGLQGCQRFCFEIETLISALEKQILNTSSEVFQQLSQAILLLTHYLQDLLNGAPDQSLKLYEVLAKLAALRGEEVEASVLFFPDLNQNAPLDHQKQLTLAQEDMLALFATQRIEFQRCLLAWLKTPTERHVQGIRDALEQVQLAQAQNSQRSFWWVATAFADTLTQKGIAAHQQVKKICRRIDQQLRILEAGNSRANQSLMKDMLYFIAIAEGSSPLIANAKSLFGLDCLIPKPAKTAQAHLANENALQADELESQTIASMLAELEAIKTAWTAVSRGEVGAFANFVSQTQTLLSFADGLSHQATIKVVVALNVFAQLWDESGLSPTEDALVEVAAGLALLEDALRDYQHINHDVQQHLLTQAQRIKNISDSVAGDAVSLSDTDHALSENALVAMASQLKEALSACEQVLDSYFRSPEQNAVLSQLDEPIKQLLAAFDMLNMQIPMDVVSASQTLIKHFSTHAGSQSQFERLADSLSLLSLFVEDFPRVNPERLQALESSLLPLKSALHSLPETLQDAALDVLEPLQKNAGVDIEIQEVFLQEAEEVLAAIAVHTRALRINLTSSDALSDLRRGFHTLKGSGRVLGLLALSELAWLVEDLLNNVIDRKIIPDESFINFSEKISQEIASKLLSLGTQGDANISLIDWQTLAAKLKVGLETNVHLPAVEEVLIGGTHKISKALFDIFIEEAHQHLQVLNAAKAMFENSPVLQSMVPVRRAAHTLASNAGAAGIKSIEDLSRHFEFWLDLEEITWSESHIKLFVSVVSALEKMLEKVKLRQQPKQVASILKALKQAVVTSKEARIETQESLPAQAGVLTATEAEAVNSDLLAMFAEESIDLLRLAGESLRSWSSDPSAKTYAEDLQRALHTLKGSARMVGKSDLGNAVHEMEDLLISGLNGSPNDIAFNTLFDCLDGIAGQLENAPVMQDKVQFDHNENIVSDTSVFQAKADGNVQQLRLRADVLDRLINEAGEISISRSRMEREMQSFKQHSADMAESLTRLRAQLREMEIEADSTLQSRLAHLEEKHESFDPLEFDRFTRLQELTRLMAESVNDVATIQHALTQNLDENEAALLQQNRMNRELQYALINIRMVPFSTISERLHRIVRQTARELDKRVELTIDGEYIDVDRSVLEHIVGALEHLLRNAVAHGLESAEARNESRKPLLGHIGIKVRRENDEIMIYVEDDGAGIRLDKVRQKAEALGRISSGQQLSEQALLGMIFEPGFSTASELTQVAGRGIGLDSVRSDVSALGGRIDVANNEGLGATFTIHLPVTLSVAQVVMVRVGKLVFALPAAMVEQVQKIKSTLLAEVVEQRFFAWNESNYPFHYLGDLVGGQHSSEPQIYTPLILLKSGQYLLALQVDEVVSNQELVMKPLGPQLTRVPGIVGASVMGDGGIVYLLNPVQMAHRESLVVGGVHIHNVKAEDNRRVVMVVDDSLTMRKVLSRLLEREGYRVVSAIHGIDALQTLQEVSPDIILTDIEMPNMDGFELVRQLRDDLATAKTPIIMISSRTAEKHQALAQTLGVDVFMGKPIHDEDLLVHITRLLA